MYNSNTEILGKLAIGDMFESCGTIYSVIKKPFGKWITVKRLSDNHETKLKSDARVKPVEVQQVQIDEVVEIDGLI